MLPAEVQSWGVHCARRAGIDEPDGVSLAAEAWASGADWWHVAALRRCVDERRRVSGQGRVDRRPLVVLDDTYADGSRVIDPTSVEQGFAQAEARADLAALVGGLDDRDLAALARTYWLGLPRDEVGCARAIRRARRPPTPPPPPAPPPNPLTDRQRQVVTLMAAGRTNDQIAAATGTTHATTKSTIARILRKLGAHDRAHAVALALRGGWID